MVYQLHLVLRTEVLVLLRIEEYCDNFVLIWFNVGLCLGIVSEDDIVMDEGDETPEPDLVFEDEQLPLATLCSLNMMRKNRHFCDVVLHVCTLSTTTRHSTVLSTSFISE